MRTEVEPYARMRHARQHIRPDDEAWLRLFLQPLTLGEAAERMGVDRGVAERAWVRVRDMLCPTIPPGTWAVPLQRVSILRMVMGLDPCWCEEDGVWQ